MSTPLRAILLCVLALLSLATYAKTELPEGYQKANWGMSVSDLQKQVTVHKATPGSEYNYSEHTEVNPDVYIQKTDHKRIEYYFFRGKLYKIFILYDRSLATSAFYKKLIKQHSEKFGPPQHRFQEKVYGIPVKHASWTDNQSSLDLRLGGGYVFQVRLQNSAAAAKKTLQQLKHSI